MKAGDRKDKLINSKSLENHDRGILTNARCLAEGVDVPSLDGVAFIDPKGSQVEIIQAVGRAIRKVRGAKIKQKARLSYQFSLKMETIQKLPLKTSNFKPVWDVLKGTKST